MWQVLKSVLFLFFYPCYKERAFDLLKSVDCGTQPAKVFMEHTIYYLISFITYLLVFFKAFELGTPKLS